MFGVYFVNKETKAVESAEVMVREPIDDVNSTRTFIDTIIHRRLLFNVLNYKNINKEVEVYLIDKHNKVTKFTPDSINVVGMHYSHPNRVLMNVDIDIYDIEMSTKEFDSFVKQITTKSIIIPELLESN